jgi:aminoglycoside 3-N-acetyltransferase
MSFSEVIERSREPLTVASLVEQFWRSGLRPGQTVLVHMAMSKLGWVIGGPEAVILALLEVLSPRGTLMMPAHTPDNSEPADWQDPPIPESWKPLVRAHTPAFNPQTTPTRTMGAVAELFRTWPGTLRSTHPMDSFAARGPNAEFLIHDHRLEEGVGERSPVGRLYELDGYVLLLGVGHGNNTSLHLAEHRAVYPGKRPLRTGSAMLVDGRREWVAFETLFLSERDFKQLGRAFEAAAQVKVHRVGLAEARFFRQRALVDYAVGWMEEYRV